MCAGVDSGSCKHGRERSAGMNKEIAAKRAYLRQQNAKFGIHMERVPQPWPLQQGCCVIDVWRSKDFLAQVVIEKNSGRTRISIQRTMINELGEWLEGIGWEDLQRVKSEIGYGDVIALEVYPRDKDVVNVANMRHLFIVDFELGWTS
jgi:hypothetical protein